RCKARDRSRLPRDRIQYSFLGSVVEQSVLSDRRPRVTVSALHRNALTREMQSASVLAKAHRGSPLVLDLGQKGGISIIRPALNTWNDCCLAAKARHVPSRRSHKSTFFQRVEL